MVDISGKNVTKRIAIAAAIVKMSKKVFSALRKNECPKGNVLDTAKVAGIMAAKSTPMIISII